MKNIILIIFVILLIPFSGVKTVTSYYNPLTNQIYCNGYDCMHEVGHFIDRNSGVISQSKEFKEYFKNETFYGINGYPRAKWSQPVDLVSFPDKVFGWGGWFEFYANNFWNYYGCENMMPESMRKFYNFDMAYKELKKYGIDNDILCPITRNVVHNLWKPRNR
jgi:hypothetical protein